ncbi:hypothetical protein F5876DRAFT_82371 [Lentinula aff. lateritia]|uniref:Uncharacterized protein n=1 Tax=Lentinula aff. lateritia TaxID=2804960 RepID=A0ACC1TJK2_9AGAR|nr:hypothetical protein F5876DRAFT_82371 [Lentinula aff. lateritia]
MPSSPDKTRSASPRFAACHLLFHAAFSSIPFEQGGVPSVVSEDDEDVDQLAFTLDAPSHPQLDLFEKVFNTGKFLVLGAGWSSKGATGTATEDGNDLVVTGTTR